VNEKDLRKYANQTNVRLVLGGLVFLIVGGDLLIYLIFGPQAAITGLLCFGAGLVPIALVLLVFWLLDWILKRARQ
jgi:hypothetical protein